MVIPEKGYKIHPGYGLVIKYNGLFDWNRVYKTIYSWLDSRKYDINEKENTKKERQKGDEVIVNIEALRKQDEYTQFEIDVEVLITHLIKVKVDGKKVVNIGKNLPRKSL